MARPDLKQDSKTFLSALRRSGSSGNGALRTALGWSETRYWKAHSSLIEAGKIEKGRGRGGSVSMA
jgi:type I restriction enzyme M protein